MRANAGYVREMGRLVPNDTNTSVLRPYGVWAVIAPWNFPYALLGAPVAAALVTGNTVVVKPSSDTPLSGVKLAEIFQQAGLPPGTFNCLPGSGRVVGDALRDHPDVAGADLHRLVRRRLPPPLPELRAGVSPSPASSRWAARTRRGHGQRRSGRGRPGRVPVGVRHERAQVLGLLARVTSTSDVADDFVNKLATHDRGQRARRPARQGHVRGPAGDAGRATTTTSATWRWRARRATSCAPAAGREGRRARARLLRAARPCSPACRATPVDARRAVRPHRRRRDRRQPGRGAGAGQRHQVRADRGFLLARAGRDRRLPRRASRRASSTSTAPPAPPPARGRACNRSAAGRAAARRGRTSAASTRCPATCASRAGHVCHDRAATQADRASWRWPTLAAQPISIVTEPPGPAARR